MDKAPKLGPERWHTRFLQQAGWTKQVRRYLCDELHLSDGTRILEVGCGTGVITADLASSLSSHIFGLDILPVFLHKASSHDPQTSFTCGDAFHLPFKEGKFDHCICHFLLLWLSQPVQALKEMLRVTQPGGYIILFAEPDYSARIDYPEPLKKLGLQQSDALAFQGANPVIGRSIAHLLLQAGCFDVHSGVMGGQWNANVDTGFIQSEHDIIRADLCSLHPDKMMPDHELEDLLTLDRQAWKEGFRILYVPTFYAWGRVP